MEIMEEKLNSEPSNQRLIILLVILVVALLVLIGTWQGGLFNGKSEVATTTAIVPKVLTEAEKADVIRSLRFAVPASSTEFSIPVATKKIQEASNSLRVSDTKPAPLGIKEMQDVLKGL